MAGVEDNSNETISEQFDEALKMYDELSNTMEPSNSPQYQGKVKKTINLLEDVTRKVSQVGVFSSNEMVEEVATSDLKLFLLPVLLGDLTLKRNHENRLNLLEVAEIYYRDFLKRCREYSLMDVRLSEEGEKTQEQKTRRPGPPSFEEMARERELKILQFQEKKEMEGKILELKKALDNPSYDEDVCRQYYLLLIKKFVSATLDELKSIETEKPIVEHMEKMKAQGKPVKKNEPARKPLAPIIITKDAFQKKVFGLGYPSIPAMTVEELVQQRMEQGWYDNHGSQAGKQMSLMDKAKQAEAAALQAEDEKAEKERKVATDDPEALAKARAFDDWKDDHRRGYGNRHNMG